MPYEYKGRPRADIEPQQELPHSLQHRPVYALPYEHFDGPLKGDSDVQYISVGLAQWNPGEVSLKVFRHTGEGGKWTRQSEELPLHRAIDAATFIAKVLFDAEPVQKSVTIPTGTFEGQEADLIITPEENNPMARNFDLYLKDGSENKERYKARLHALYKILNELVEQGKL